MLSLIDWKLLLAQIIVPILAGGLVLTIFNTFYSDFYKKPYILTTESFQGNTTSITIKNIGSAVAHNLIITTDADEKIRSFSHFATENVSVFSLTNNSIRLYSNRISQGQGSLIQINMTLDAKLQNPTKIYATYDEGANFSGEPVDLLRAIGLYLSYSNSILLLALMVVAILLSYAAYAIYSTFFGKEKAPIFLFRIKKLAVIVRDELSEDPKLDKSFFYFWNTFLIEPRYVFQDIALLIRTGVKNKPLNEVKDQLRASYSVWDSWNRTKLDVKLRYMPNTRDYILIQDFFSTLNKREEHIKYDKDKTHESISDINQECLKCATAVLEAINWEKYTGR